MDPSILQVFISNIPIIVAGSTITGIVGYILWTLRNVAVSTKSFVTHENCLLVQEKMQAIMKAGNDHVSQLLDINSKKMDQFSEALDNQASLIGQQNILLARWDERYSLTKKK